MLPTRQHWMPIWLHEVPTYIFSPRILRPVWRSPNTDFPRDNRESVSRDTFAVRCIDFRVFCPRECCSDGCIDFRYLDVRPRCRRRRWDLIIADYLLPCTVSSASRVRFGIDSSESLRLVKGGSRWGLRRRTFRSLGRKL